MRGTPTLWPSAFPEGIARKGRVQASRLIAPGAIVNGDLSVSPSNTKQTARKGLALLAPFWATPAAAYVCLHMHCRDSRPVYGIVVRRRVRAPARDHKEHGG